MSQAKKSSILFIYDFRIIPEMLEAFQEWARTKGMQYWEKQEGVIRYQTFRKESASLSMDTTSDLQGIPKKIDVFSEVEISNHDSLDQIVKSNGFQRMQAELLSFVESNSLSHSILSKAYDSTQIA